MDTENTETRTTFVEGVYVVYVGAIVVGSTYVLGRLAVDWAKFGLETLRERKARKND